MMVLFVVLLLLSPSPSIQQQQSSSVVDEIKFDLKLVNVGSTYAEFEIDDDNQTLIHYNIIYSVRSDKFEFVPPDDQEAESYHQNSISMEEKEEIETNNNLSLSKKENELMHRFNVITLEANRFYDINLTIYASAEFDEPTRHTIQTKREFQFKFTTTYDWYEAVDKACNASHSDPDSSCYQPGSGCTQCRSTCYLVPNPATKNNDQHVDNNNNKQVLCEACPCDKLRSTGECMNREPESSEPAAMAASASQSKPNEDNFWQVRKLKCKQCLSPYTGNLCHECESEGIDYYKNEAGVCSPCDCNGNSAYDLLDSTSRINYKRRKCQAITGMCLDCQFNTTGRHCNECKDGFYGNALKRTCTQITTSQSKDKAITSNNLDYLNKKYTYKTLALFSLYIFCIVGLVILTFLCIRAKYYQDQSYKMSTPVAVDNEMGGGGGGGEESTRRTGSGTSGIVLLDKVMSHVGDAFRYVSDATKNQRAHLAIYLGFNPVSSWRSSFRFLVPHSTSSSSMSTHHGPTSRSSAGGIYTAAGSRDDDRLNLAECAVFDESLFDDSPSNIYQPSQQQQQQQSNNPYNSLTIDS